MVREAGLRRRKYEAKVDPETLAVQTRALKPLMVAQETRYFPAITTVEEKVKKLVEGEGVPTIQVRDYLNFGREMYELSRKFSGSTLAGEAQLRVNKWSERGLIGTLLAKVANLFGVKPSAPPTPPPTPPKTLLGFWGAGQAGTVTRYYKFNNPTPQTSETYGQGPMPVGCFKHLKVRVYTNSHTDITTFMVRLNGKNTGLALDVPAMSIGTFTKSYDVVVNENDLACLMVVTRSAWTLTFNPVFVFELW